MIMWLPRILTALVLVSFATCRPPKIPGPKKDQDSPRHLTTGITTRNNGHPYIRHEIRDLKNHYPDQWNLYLLGLQAFQQMDEGDPLSYYKIMGIHGRPYKVWQDAQGVPNGGGKSYCPHSNRLFFSWHRPYLALFEQELYKQIRKITNAATTSQIRWRLAADAFRIPYWDWALGDKGGDLPDFFIAPSIQVAGPDGKQRTISNPLYQFDFHPLNSQDFDGKWAQLNSTVRWPTSNDPDEQSQPQKWIKDFQGGRRRYHDSVSQAFMSGTFNEFSSNIEAVHGSIHSNVAGWGEDIPSGHMLLPEYSAFDPVFMLHHANVDRLHALYQAMHPDRWIDPSNVGTSGNFWIPNDATVDAGWQLQPFWKDNQTFYTSNDVRNTTILGYAYPETQSWTYSSDNEWRAAVNRSVAQLYSLSARSMLNSSGATSRVGFNRVLKQNTFVDWTVKTKSFSLYMPSTFRVVFSLTGSSSSAPVVEAGQWMKLMPAEHDNDLGWKTLRANQKANPSSLLGPTMKGTVSLTSTLLDRIAAAKIKCLDPSAVVPYLKDHLTWKILAGAEETEIVENDPEFLTVEVVSNVVRIPADASKPLQYIGKTISYPGITRGKYGDRKL